MSEPEEQPKLDLDLGTAFLPSWAQKPAKENPYAKYEGRDNDRSGRRDSRRSDRFDRSRNQRPGDRRRPGGGDRDNSQRRQSRPQDSKARAPQGGEGQNRRPARPGGQDRTRQQKPRHRSRQEIIASLPGLKVSIIPDQKGVESLAKQIRMQGRAYPLFDIATLVLKRPDRFRVSTSLQSDAKGHPVSEQWRCLLDDTLWLSQGEAIDHVLNEHFEQFYERLKTETNPPKGNFTFVAQCGISGKILGPPNYHGYQDALRSLHAERFARMNFDAFKDRVRIVREEEVVKKWIDEQSWKTEYKSKANAEAEPLGSWEALVEDFKANHLKDTLETGRTLTISAAAGLKTPSRPLQELIRFHVEDQRRFPLQVATILSQMFARQGLQFFKVNRTITHVSVARPKYLDMNETPVSTGVQKIVEFIDATPDCNRKKLFDALKPAGTNPAAENTAAAESPAATESTSTENPSDSKESATPAGEKAETASEESATQTTPEPPRQASPEETAIITDLHWLIHQGHVIEFSNGKMETAKKPAPRPEKTDKKASSPKPAATTTAPTAKEASETTNADESTAAPEVAPPTSESPKPETEVPKAPTPESSTSEAPKAEEVASAPKEASTPETAPQAPTEPTTPSTGDANVPGTEAASEKQADTTEATTEQGSSSQAS